MKDNKQLEPLDYALKANQTEIAVYLCQHCISSDEMLNPSRIKTTVNLISRIMKANPLCKWETSDGDNILQLVGNSELCISHIMPSETVLDMLVSGVADGLQLHWSTSDGDKLLELVCQSKSHLSQIYSTSLFKWFKDDTIIKVKKSIPDSKTADGKALIQLVCQSKVCLFHISTVVLS